MNKLEQLIEQLEKSNKFLGQQLKKSFNEDQVRDEQEEVPAEDPQAFEQQAEIPNEEQEVPAQEAPVAEDQGMDPQVQEIVELMEAIPKEMIPSIIEALQAKLEEPDMSEMAKSYKAMQQKIAELEKSISSLTTPVKKSVIPSKTKVEDIEVIEKSKTNYGETGPKMLKKSVLIDRLKRDPSTKTGVLEAASDLPENDSKALRKFYDFCEDRGIKLPLE